MKVLKKSLCIFMAVVMLFFGVNNSYFSPHKMDTVEATGLEVVGGVAITADLIIKLVAALAVAGLAVGVIVEWSDMDIEALAMDVHAWCKENYDSISGYLEAQPALKEWILSDYWVVVVDGASGSSPEPSPSPDDEEEQLPSTGQEETGLTQEQFEALLNDHHGFTNAFKWVAGGTATGITLTSILAPISYVAEYGHYVDAEGNILESDDPRIKSVTMENSISMIAQAYMQARIDDFASDSAGTDPVTQALQSRYVSDDELPHYYGELQLNDSGLYKLRCQGVYDDATQTITHVYSLDTSNKPFAVLKDNAYSFYYVNDKNDGYVTAQTILYSETYNKNTGRTSTYSQYAYSAPSDNVYNYSLSIPVFSSLEAAKEYIASGDDSACINRERANNYIDTNDDYGWASTANISPNDLAAAMPDVAGNLDGRSVSLSGVMAAINALKNQLEENNPNTGSDVAVPYPNVDDYVSAVTSVVTDPDVFPRADDVADTAPDTDVDDVVEPAPDTDTMKDYSGLLGLIINILRDILQAIKDLLSWFVIDFSAIKAHLLLALDSAPALSGIDGFLALVDYAKTQITDSYEYPVIVIDCPEILKPYWKQEQIILLDFEDYATYFIWVRTAMAFAILFGFVIVLIKEFKVSFTLN